MAGLSSIYLKKEKKSRFFCKICTVIIIMFISWGEMFDLQLVTAPSWQEVLTGNRNLNWEYFCIIMLQGIKRATPLKF